MFPCILWFQLYNGQFVALLFDPHSECRFQLLPSHSHLQASAFISCQHYPYTQSHSKVFDVIKAIWPSFNHWENWVVPPSSLVLWKQTKSNQSYKRLLIDVILLEVKWWTGHDWLLLSATCLALSWRFMSTLIWCLIFFLKFSYQSPETSSHQAGLMAHKIQVGYIWSCPHLQNHSHSPD